MRNHIVERMTLNDPIKLSSVDINVLHILSTNTKLTYNTLAEALSSSSATAETIIAEFKSLWIHNPSRVQQSRLLATHRERKDFYN